MDVILYNFTNCGFVGQSYGNFKTVVCVNVFDDVYHIARSLTIIAFMAILIVFFSLCLDYVYGPLQKTEPEIDKDLSQYSLPDMDSFQKGIEDNDIEMQPPPSQQQPLQYTNNLDAPGMYAPSVASFHSQGIQPPAPSIAPPVAASSYHSAPGAIAVSVPSEQELRLQSQSVPMNDGIPLETGKNNKLDGGEYTIPGK